MTQIEQSLRHMYELGVEHGKKETHAKETHAKLKAFERHIDIIEENLFDAQAQLKKLRGELNELI